MFVLISLAIFTLKFLAIGVVGLFFVEDLELTQSAGTVIYSIYFILGVTTFFSLLFFILGRRMLWLIVFLSCGISYLGMYNSAPDIKEIHQQHDLKSRYFKDSQTFFARMVDVIGLINK